VGIGFDKEKRDRVLRERGVDLVDVDIVLADPRAITVDQVRGGELRHLTIGMGPDGRLLSVVWTRRGEGIRAMTAWKANAREQARYGARYGD